MESFFIDPTSAKDVALYFAKAINKPIDSKFMSYSINLAKNILGAGWKKRQIEETIDWVVKRNPSVYSLGYIATCIEEVQNQIQNNNLALIAKQKVIEMTENASKEVIVSETTGTRNKDKQSRPNFESTLRKKSAFDMLE